MEGKWNMKQNQGKLGLHKGLSAKGVYSEVHGYLPPTHTSSSKPTKTPQTSRQGRVGRTRSRPFLKLSAKFGGEV